MALIIAITILSAIGIFIFSTIGPIRVLNGEVVQLFFEKCNDFEYKISRLKIQQIFKLSNACGLLVHILLINTISKISKIQKLIFQHPKEIL